MTDRIPCIVPFCNRTRKPTPAYDEWICPKHWRPVPRRLKDLYGGRKRRFRRDPSLRNAEAVRRAWTRCKDTAVGLAL